MYLNARTLAGLGSTPPPKISDTKKNTIADPNTTLEVDGSKKGRESDWTCNDWVLFHKAILQWFKEGRLASKIKYPNDQALVLANQVFRQHWDRASWTLTRCGYTSDFSTYFKSVGLSDILNFAQKAVAKGKETAAAVGNSGAKTLVNTVDTAGQIVNNVGGGIANIAGAAKYILPVAIGGVVIFVGVYAYKNFIKGNSRISVPTPGGVVQV
jgi:hypothetical protein